MTAHDEARDPTGQCHRNSGQPAGGGAGAFQYAGVQHRPGKSGVQRWSARQCRSPCEKGVGRLVEEEWVLVRWVRTEYDGSTRLRRTQEVTLGAAERAVLRVLVMFSERKQPGILAGCHLDQFDAGRRANLRPLCRGSLFCGKCVRN